MQRIAPGDSQESTQPVSPAIDPGPAPAARKRPRVEFIDVTRGVLFTLMTSSHALAITNVPENHFFNSLWWLPRLWATFCFIILSGFSVAFLFDWQNKPAAAAAKMRRRAFQLLVVMFVSNIVMLALALAAQHNLRELARPAWWLGLLTLETGYSISAILIPTALLLLACRALAALGRRLGAWAYLAALLAAAWLGAALTLWLEARPTDTWLTRHFITQGIGGFPVLQLWLFGAIGFGFGQLWKRHRATEQWPLLAAGAALCALLRYVWSPAAFNQHKLLTHTLAGPSYFLTVLAVVLLAERVNTLKPALGIPRLIGKYALFSFIAHRIVLQALFLVYSTAFKGLAPATGYMILFPATMAVIWTACRLRESGGAFDRALKKIYL